MGRPKDTDDIEIVDEWYRSQCNGLWEHRYGVKIVTCDNPGWLVTFSDLPLPQKDNAEFLSSLKREFGAEVLIEESEVRLFARSLRMCLAASVKLIEISKSAA